MNLTRRNVLTAMSAAAIIAPALAAPALAQGGGNAPLKINLLLNSGIAGPHAFFCLANQRGYFKEAGLEVEFAPGDGAASVVPRVPIEGFDAGYGDVNMLIKLAALRPENCPKVVHVAFSGTPLTIAVRKDGPIKEAKDLAGKVIIGHPQDAAIEAFPPYAVAGGLDPHAVHILRSNASMALNSKEVIDGNVDGVFGFVNTVIAALRGIDIDAREHLDFLEFTDLVPELYGNALMFSPAFIEENPEAVRAFVAAVNRGIIETIADPDAGLAAVAEMSPKYRPEVDGPRLMGTLEMEMNHPDAAVHGIGDATDERIARSISLMVDSAGLPRSPAPEEIFTREFLPPLEERARPVG
ncbi:MAG TPA: ABC transporter substrate-binding protein [Amaricoccus sp.]|uniref:ABC transporter substrate-binding protein n=1 Tax=Amaricoccus sp. TaxID=1872485 RepID=UPI002C73D12D|nr:ABC transporter substrate-binding protein [Amaricoccus sp.]HMQ93154.1 ABC transporter substrate-binding protein [Amaricoccus sp.]HMR53956.1 ABC transporter substrate-binding protein [Amaricoccus sp.]HMR60180.1 ABC transporter substrate-binding protein [Amaricoccus sp.]HMU00952.1 ABC transporter substrate-binding protein [Amaricoccus sp.]